MSETQPEAPAVPAKPIAIVEMAAEQLANLLDCVLPFASTDPDRSKINTVLLDVEGAKINAVATDGHRLTQCAADLDVKHSALRARAWAPRFTAVIPRGEAMKVRAALSKITGACRLSTTDGGELIVSGTGYFGRVDLRVPLAPSPFPPWRSVMSRRSERVCVNRRDFMAAMRMACENRESPPTTNPATVSLALSGGVMTVRQDDAVSVDLPARYWGPSRIVHFNPRYLLEAASATGAEFIAMEFGEQPGPCTIRDQDDSPAFVAVIMGVRV